MTGQAEPAMRVLVVDDEAPARRRLAMMLGEIAGVTVTGEAANGADALEKAEALRPDLVLLDIEMPGIDGIEVAAALADTPAIVIFVTAFDHYAVQAFEQAAIDYLLKPVAFERMETAIARARASLHARRSAAQAEAMAEVIATLRRARPARPDASRHVCELWVQRRGERVRVDVAGIDWIEAERDYVRLHLGDTSYLLRERIGDLAAELDPQRFVRIHRSTIVRRNAVHSVRRAGFGALVVVLNDGIERRVGRNHSGAVRGLIAGAKK